MARDATQVKNIALAYVGEVPLVSGTEATKAQRAINLVYEEAIEIVAKLPFNWKFMTARAELAKVADADGDVAPAFGYTYQYVIPANCKRIIAFVDESGDKVEYEYRREMVVVGTGDSQVVYDVILTDENECWIKYIYLRTTPAKWPAEFAHLVSLQSALMICEPLKQDKLKLNQLMLMYLQARRDAKAANAKEDMDVDDNVNVNKGNRSVVTAAGDEEAQRRYLERA